MFVSVIGVARYLALALCRSNGCDGNARSPPVCAQGNRAGVGAGGGMALFGETQAELKNCLIDANVAASAGPHSAADYLPPFARWVALCLKWLLLLLDAMRCDGS